MAAPRRNQASEFKQVSKLNPKAEDIFSLQSYAAAPKIDGVQISELPRFNDDGGSITELGRFANGALEGSDGFQIAQINYSDMEPNVIKAFHLHRRQTDVWYVPPRDKLLLVLHDCREDSPTAGKTMRIILGDGNQRLVLIPPGVAHGARNIGTQTGQIIYMVDVQFSTDKETCDEGRLPWDYLGEEIWEIAKG